MSKTAEIVIKKTTSIPTQTALQNSTIVANQTQTATVETTDQPIQTTATTVVEKTTDQPAQTTATTVAEKTTDQPAQTAATTVAEKTTDQPAQTTATTVAKKTTAAKHSNEKTPIETSSTPAIKLQNSLPADLIFPSQFSDIQRENSLILLIKYDVAAQAQLLLDALAARFSLTTWQAIRNPMAYFTQLIRSYQDGKLDTQYAENIAQKRIKAKQKPPTKSSHKGKSITITSPQATPREKAASFYQQAVSMAKHAGCSLREMAQELQTEARLEAAGYDLGSGFSAD